MPGSLRAGEERSAPFATSTVGRTKCGEGSAAQFLRNQHLPRATETKFAQPDRRDSREAGIAIASPMHGTRTSGR